MEADMALTKSFKELVQARAVHDPTFAQALLCEGFEAMLAGNIEAGKSALRDYINATVGFEKLAQATATSPKSLMRMFGSQGNPQARNLFGVIAYLQAEAQLRLRVAVDRRAQGAPRARHRLPKPAA
jgi:DNA-binding phage protein